MNTKKFLLSEIDKIKCLDEESQAILKNIKQSIIDNF
jgi:hypothetical protein